MTKHFSAPSLCGLAALVLLLGGAGEGRAVVLNDAAAAAAGGIGNYFDSTNSFPNVVSLYSPGANSFCTGSLINSRTILTAAHCISDKGTPTLTPDTQISFSPNITANVAPSRAISGAVQNAGYTGGINDIAMISLATPVTTIAPVVLLLPGATIPAVGTTIIMVGYGGNGTGANPPTATGPIDGKRRVGFSELGAYAADSGQLYFQAQFRNPLSPGNPDAFGLNASGIPTNPLEAGVAQGDSGGPLFIQTANGLVQIGEVQSGSGGTPANGYGETNLWTPVNVFATWMAQNSPLRQLSSNAGNFNWSNPAAWTDSAPGGPAPIVPNNTVGTITPKTLSVGFYYNVALASPGTITLDTSRTIDSLAIVGGQSTLTVPTPSTLTNVVGTGVAGGTFNLAGGNLVTPGLGITGGRLIGTGGVTGDTVNTGGTVSPAGTLTITGSYTQGAGGVFAPQAGSDSAGKLAVTGTASLAGALQPSIVGQSKPIVSGTQYGILTAGTLTGTFSGAATQQVSPFISDTAFYTATNVNMTLNRTASYASVATTADQTAVATSLDKGLAAGTLTADMQGLLAKLDGGTVADAVNFYNRIGADGDGDSNSDVVGNQILANMASARVVEGAIDNHLAALRDGTPGMIQRNAGPRGLSGSFASHTGLGLASASDAPPEFGSASGGPASGPASGMAAPVWIQGIGAWQSLRGDDNAFGVKQSIGGLIAGIDVTPAPDLQGGVAFSYTHGSLGGGSETGATDSYRAAIYATRGFGPLYVDGRAGYGYTQMSTVRALDFADFGVDRIATGNTGGSEWSAAANAGYRYVDGAVLIEPSVGLAYDRVGRNAYSEGGAGALSLNIDDSTLQSLRLSGGVRAQARIALADGFIAWPELRARYVYETMTPFPTTTATLQGDPGTSFDVEGVNTGHRAAVLGAGVTLARAGNLAFYANYGAEMRKNETVQSVVAGLRVNW